MEDNKATTKPTKDQSAEPAILVVEDEGPLANAVSLKLKSNGFTVYRAADGVEALEMLEENPVDLILLDILLPNLDGFEVLKRIRESGNEVTIIMATNLSQSEDKQKALDLGANDYLVKSDIQLSELVEYINKSKEKEEELPETA